MPGLTDRLETGIRVLDAGCGRGRILIRLAALYPKSQFVGMDLSEAATSTAREEARSHGLRNVEFVAVDLAATSIRTPNRRRDLITTFDAVHDQAHPLSVSRAFTGPSRPMAFT